MIVEMQIREYHGTWDLVPLPFRKKTIGYCCCVYSIKVGFSGEVDHLC